MADTRNQAVNIKVENLRKGDKPHIALMDVYFDGNAKRYSYARKFQSDGEGNQYSIVSGCRITFDYNFNLISITREYDVAGVKKKKHC